MFSMPCWEVSASEGRLDTVSNIATMLAMPPLGKAKPIDGADTIL